MWNIGHYSRGMMGYQNAEHRPCGQGRSDFHRLVRPSRAAPLDAQHSSPGKNPLRTGLTKVGMPGATLGLQPEDPTIAELLKPLGYATGQVLARTILAIEMSFCQPWHGFDEFFGKSLSLER